MRTCKHCNRSTRSTDDVARVEGWRWYDGPTIGGGRLVDVVCPICAGNTTAAASERWNVICETCDWDYQSEHYEGDEPLTEAKDAVELGYDHECEPRIKLRSPAGDLFDLNDFDRHGNPWPLAVAS